MLIVLERTALRVAATLALIGGGCANLGYVLNPEGRLTPDERSYYFARGGDDLLHDAELTRATIGRRSELEHICLAKYARGRAADQEHSDGVAVEDYGYCARACRANGGTELPALVDKYERLCGEGWRAAKQRFYLPALRKQVEEARAARDAYTFARGVPDVERQFDVAASNLDDGDPGIKALRQDYAAILKGRAADLQRVETFTSRPDVRDIEHQIGLLKREVESAYALYRVTGDPLHRELARAKEAEIVPLGRIWTEKAVEAGIVAPRP